eukprot:506778-Rhodomonas_salina.1
MGHVPVHSGSSASRHHELDVSALVCEGVDWPGQMALPSLCAHPPPLSASSAHSWSTDSWPLPHADLECEPHVIA